MENFFYIKSAEADEKKGVIIEGYANYNAIDRVKERMDPKTVLLENFKNNPILLFNHDMDYPVGKVLELEPRDEGLYVKARVSGVNESKVSYIRELVLDGVLKAFSIRYDVEDYSKSFMDDPENEGGTLIKYWELQELSIVTIPCQQDSLFSIAGVKTLGDFRAMALNTKGASAAAMINKAIDAVVKGGMEKSDVLERLSQISGIELGEVNEILAGNITPIPDSFVGAVTEVLEISKSELKDADGADVEKEGDAPVTVEQKEKSDSEGEEKEPEEKPEMEKDLDEGKCDNKECEKADCKGECTADADEKSSEETEEKEPEEKSDDEKKKELDRTVHENPMLERFDSIIALLGSISVKLDALIQKTETPEDEPKGVEQPMVEDDEAAKVIEAEPENDEMEKAEETESEPEVEETEDEKLKKGFDSLRSELGEACKKSGIDIEQFFKVK